MEGEKETDAQSRSPCFRPYSTQTHTRSQKRTTSHCVREVAVLTTVAFVPIVSLCCISAFFLLLFSSFLQFTVTHTKHKHYPAIQKKRCHYAHQENSEKKKEENKSVGGPTVIRRKLSSERRKEKRETSEIQKFVKLNESRISFFFFVIMKLCELFLQL